MEYTTITTTDSCPLAIQTSLPLSTASSNPRSRRCIILMHGFSGSSAYFQRNFAALSAHSWVIAPDMRSHGRSGRTAHGFHVARLAVDLRELIAALRAAVPAPASTSFVPVGCSIGAAVLWTYVELFGCADFAGLVCVDQAPLQDRSGFGGAWDVERCHRGCFDEASMLAAQRAWVERPDETHRGLVAECLGYRFAPEEGDDVSAARRGEDESFFVGISRQSDNVWLARLLGDHTRYDHREACELITVPTLVMAGRRTGCFPLEGMKETVERVNKARPGLGKWSLFEAGHWLFYEEPDRFNKEIMEFVEACT